jgi:hypothetical protein
MSSSPLDEQSLSQADLREIHAALFAQLITSHAHSAMILLGRYPDPGTGQTRIPDPEEAKIYIDQLEMLQAKTRGNLSPDEIALLERLLRTTGSALVQAIDAAGGQS